MQVPVSWITDYVELPSETSTAELAHRLTDLGLKLEAITTTGGDIRGPLVIGRVLTMEAEPQKNGKIINWCTVDVGEANGTGQPQGIVCGAHNFSPGDLVVVVLPGGVLPGNFEISARKTYGHISAGMICSARELGIGDDHDGIIVLPSDAGAPGDSALPALGLDEELIEFEINPDRAYALSLRGIAREAALAYDATFIDPALRSTPEPNQEGYPVLVEDPSGCPVFVTRLVTKFDPAAPTPEWMKRRLEGAGQRSISLAVDVTNYVMFELGRPIHAYDADKLQGPLRIRRANAGETLVTIDDQERTLSPEDLVVADDSGPIGLGGVMGGASTEISEHTTRVLIEAAHWDPVSMFRTGRRHKLTSEAGKRNERGVDPTICEAAADRVAELLVRYGGGELDPGVTVVQESIPIPTITLPTDLPARITGVEISAVAARECLEAVGAQLEQVGDKFQVTPPPWRSDITDPFDLVEEVIRLVGYDQVPSVLPTAPAGGGLTSAQRMRRRVGRQLAAAGLVEVLTFPFVGVADFDALGLAEADPRRNALQLANPLRAEEPLMTTTLLPRLLQTASRNHGRGLDDVGIYELATVTQLGTDNAAPILRVDRPPTEAEWTELTAAVPHQPWHVGVVMSGRGERAGWWGAGRTVEWADVVEVVRVVGASLGVNLEISAAEQAPWHPGRCAVFTVDSRGENCVVGYAGELHPKVVAEYGLPARAVAAEFNVDVLIQAAPTVVLGPHLSTYPVAKEDVALLVDSTLPAAELAKTLAEGAGQLCEEVRLFDSYTGDQVGEGKKSLAFSLRFRAHDRTLTDAETQAARAAAVELAQRRHGAIQR